MTCVITLKIPYKPQVLKFPSRANICHGLDVVSSVHFEVECWYLTAGSDGSIPTKLLRRKIIIHSFHRPNKYGDNIKWTAILRNAEKCNFSVRAYSPKEFNLQQERCENLKYRE